MAQVDVTVTINRPIEEVFTALADTDHQNQWQPIILETRKLSDGPVGVGTTYRYVSQFLGQRFETTGELTDYEPPRRYGWRVTTGPFPMRAQYTLVPSGSSTQVTGTFIGDPGSFFKLAKPVVVRMGKRQIEADLNNLKELLEARAETGG